MPARKNAGRKRIQFDLDQVQKLGALHCPPDEIAAFFDCSRDTIEREIERNPEFAEALAKGRAHGKMAVRRKQIDVALGGNIVMLIWLGKQLLGQIETAANTFNISATANARADARTPEQVKTHLVELQRAVLAEAQRLNIEAN